MSYIANTCDLAKTFMYNSTIGVAKKVYNEGWFGVYRIYSVTGFEKLTKVILADIRMFPVALTYLSSLPKIGAIFKSVDPTLLNGLKPPVECQKDFCYALLSVDAVIELTSLEKKDFNQSAFLKTASKICLAIGCFFETGKFFSKYGICEWPTFARVGTALGNYQVFDRKPFDYRPFSTLLGPTPKDLFVFVGSGLAFIDYLKEFWYSEHDRRREYCFSVENIAKLVSNLGKMGLIWWGKSHCNSPLFIVLDFITQHASLFGHILKRPISPEAPVPVGRQ